MRNTLIVGMIFTAGICIGQQNHFSYIGKTNDNIKHYASFKKYDSIRDEKDVWVKLEYPAKKIKNKKGNYVTVNGKKKVALVRVFCEEKKLLTLATVEYYGNDDIVRSDNNSEYAEPIHVVPESMGESIFRYACENIVQWDTDTRIDE